MTAARPTKQTSQHCSDDHPCLLLLLCVVGSVGRIGLFFRIPSAGRHCFFSQCWSKWALELAVHTGKSDQNVINNIVVDFLHGPYRSHEDPMDVLFGSTGVDIRPFSVGISVGSAKCRLRSASCTL